MMQYHLSVRFTIVMEQNNSDLKLILDLKIS